MEATARNLEIGSAAIPEAQASLPPTPRAEEAKPSFAKLPGVVFAAMRG